MPSEDSGYWICPLYGFSYDVDDVERIELSSEVAIWRTPPDLLNNIDMSYPQLKLQRNKVRWAIYFPYNPKQKELHKEGVGYEIDDDAREILFCFITTLRLYRKAELAPSILFLINNTKGNFNLVGYTVWSNLSKTGDDIFLNDAKYELTETDIAGLREFWSDFHEKQQNDKLTWIQIALSRFNSSYSGSLEDRLLDQ